MGLKVRLAVAHRYVPVVVPVVTYVCKSKKRRKPDIIIFIVPYVCKWSNYSGETYLDG